MEEKLETHKNFTEFFKIKKNEKFFNVNLSISIDMLKNLTNFIGISF